MKKCSNCGVSKSSNSFAADCHKRNGIRSRCKECLKENRGEKHSITRGLVIQAKSKPCMDCGINYPWYVMDLDHVRGKKKFKLSHATSKSANNEKVLAEIAKCDPVCANCHRIRTFGRKQVVSSEGVIHSSH